jgi:hypothetical protein
MNCTTCRYELSQCLDGRLPSGRRTVVMQHAETCAACGQFWAELQAAQRLTLQLQQPRVSPGFREELWERIRAGEGTPEAVFREQVPTLTKLRYALTGAAAAAGVLLAASLWRGDPQAPTGAQDPIAQGQAESGPTDLGAANPVADAGNRLQPRSNAPRGTTGGAQVAGFAGNDFHDNPLLASSQRLTPTLVAVETAKQLEQRYEAVNYALRRAESNPAEAPAAIREAWQKADEFQGLGEVLLDLRNRQRLSFRDQEVDSDLRFAVNMLRRGRQGLRDETTVRTVVGEALRSDRLGSLSRTIYVAPSVDPREDMDVLVHLNTQRPDVFRQLFFVLPSPNADELNLLVGEAVFLMADDCGPSWVAPRSEVTEREALNILRQQLQGGGVQVKIHQVGGPR